MKKNWITFLVVLAVTHFGIVSAQAQDEIVSYLKVYTGEAGEEVLFLRKDPILAGYLGFEQDSVEEIGRTVSLYAMASSLTVSYTTDETNLLIIRTENVNTGDRLNAAALEKYKMPAEVISAMVETFGWTSGCGVYAFRNRKGRISLSVGVVDMRLDRIMEKLCTSHIIARSFGIGWGPKTALPIDISHLKYGYLLNVIVGCEAKSEVITPLAIEICTNESVTKLTFGN